MVWGMDDRESPTDTGDADTATKGTGGTADTATDMAATAPARPARRTRKVVAAAAVVLAALFASGVLGAYIAHSLWKAAWIDRAVMAYETEAAAPLAVCGPDARLETSVEDYRKWLADGPVHISWPFRIVASEMPPYALCVGAPTDIDGLRGWLEANGARVAQDIEVETDGVGPMLVVCHLSETGVVAVAPIDGEVGALALDPAKWESSHLAACES